MIDTRWTSLDHEQQKLQEYCVVAAQSSFLAFLQFVWWMPGKLHIGRHTIETCELLTKAVFDYLDGKSTFLIVNMPFRHGKTDMVSRAFPAWFLGVCADRQPDVILTGYGSDLVIKFSDACKKIIKSPEYQAVFPGVTVDVARDAKKIWGIQDSSGVVNCTGLGGGLTGNGYDLGVVDDYCKSREEAFSQTYREKTWDAFAVDFLTRRAPVSITIVCATPWHPDDVTGRILKALKTKANFPPFRQIKFPATKAGDNGWNYLFPERFSASWYKEQRETLGANMAAALLDCTPVGLGTKMFTLPLDEQKLIKLPNRQNMNVYIFIDSANATKRDSDYTCMWVVGLAEDQNYYVLDGIRDRINLDERTQTLFELVRKWQPHAVFWEQMGAMSDVQHVKYVQSQEGYHFSIATLHQKLSKEDRIAWLVPIFERSALYFPQRIMYKGTDGVTRDLIQDFENDEYDVFPAVAHDDMLDALANIRHPDALTRIHFPRKIEKNCDYDHTEEWNPW